VREYASEISVDWNNDRMTLSFGFQLSKLGELTAFNENSFVDGTTVGIRRLLAEKETTRVESVHNTEQQHCDKISVVAHRDFLVVVNFDFDEIAVVVEPDCVFGLSTSSPLYH